MRHKIERSLSWFKKRAWKACSLYVRVRECLHTTGTLDYGFCFTCGVRIHIKEMHAGHFVAGRTNAVLFDDIAIRGQCYRCNIHKGGEPLIFRKNLIKEHGEETVDILESNRWKTKRYSKIELDALYYVYKKKYDDLKLAYYKRGVAQKEG